MGLWGGISDILQSSYCNLPGITDILKTVPDLLRNGVLSEVNLIENHLNNVGQLLKSPNDIRNELLSGVGNNHQLLNGIGSNNNQQGLLGGIGNNNNSINKNNQLVGVNVLTGHISDLKKNTLPTTPTLLEESGSKTDNKKHILNIQRPLGILGK